jgi:hypothetical protein
MKYYIQGMLDEFPFEVKPSQTTPWTEKLFKIQEDAKKLGEERRSIFHTFVMKAIFHREHDQISNQISFYPHESMTQTKETGRNYCGL